MIASAKARLTFRIRLYRTTNVVRQAPRRRNQGAFSTVLFLTPLTTLATLLLLRMALQAGTRIFHRIVVGVYLVRNNNGSCLLDLLNIEIET
jgi:hypothetical protein